MTKPEINLINTTEVAIENALGSAIQNIVTHTEEDAKVMIEFLKEFLPLIKDKIKNAVSVFYIVTDTAYIIYSM